MNWPNIISFSRIPILFVIIVLLHVSFPGSLTLVATLYILGALSDWLDGYIARKYNIVSNFGKLLDALTDKIFVMGMFVTMLGMGLLPQGAVFAVVIIMAREFLVTGIRVVAATRGTVLPAERLGKLKTMSQLFCLGFYIWTYALGVDFFQYTPSWLLTFGSLGSIVLLILATVLTIVSGISYARNNWSLLTEEMDK